MASRSGDDAQDQNSPVTPPAPPNSRRNTLPLSTLPRSVENLRTGIKFLVKAILGNEDFIAFIATAKFGKSPSPRNLERQFDQHTIVRMA